MGVISTNLSRIQIVMMKDCRNHNAQPGEPCWELPVQNGNSVSPAVCGRRTKRAGFTGGVSAASVRQTPSAKYK